MLTTGLDTLPKTAPFNHETMSAIATTPLNDTTNIVGLFVNQTTLKSTMATTEEVTTEEATTTQATATQETTILATTTEPTTTEEIESTTTITNSHASQSG